MLSAPAASTINGTAGNDTLYGTAGANTINGNGGNDILVGGHGNDILNGGAGNDILRGGFGNDRLDGGADDDVLEDFGEGTDTLIGGTGNDIITVRHNYVYANETITIQADDGDDQVSVSVGESGSARAIVNVDLGAGNDTYLVAAIPRGGLTLTLGTGSDIVRFNPSMSASPEVPIHITDFQTGDGGDIFDASFLINFEGFLRPFGGYYEYTGAEFFNPFYFGQTHLEQVGNDVHLFVAPSSTQRPFAVFENTTLADFTAYNLGMDIALTTYTGTTGADNFAGTAGRDVARGGNGNDTLSGQAGDDLLDGASGNDTLNGGAGFNFLSGGAGDDVITGGNDGNVVYTGAGFNRVTTGSGNDIVVSDGRDIIDTGDGDDLITAEDLTYDFGATPPPQYTITAGAGADEVWLREGNFIVSLGTGDDELHVGVVGNMIATLGTGVDRVFYDSQFVRLTLTDFQAGNGGDIFILGLDYLLGSNPFASGALYLQQVGANTHLYTNTSLASEPLVVFQNTQASNLTAYNFDGFNLTPPVTADTIEIFTGSTFAQGTTQTSINPSNDRNPTWGAHISFFPPDTYGELINNGTIVTSNTTPITIRELSGIDQRGGGEDGLIRNGTAGIIRVNAHDIDANGIYANGEIPVINNGLIEVNWTGTDIDTVYGVFFGGYGNYNINPNDRLTNNGDIIVTSQVDATGVRLDNGGSLINTGLLSVHADEFAIGVNAQFANWGTPLNNSGEIVVTTAQNSPFLTYGILIEALNSTGIPDAQTIVNSGLIDADFAIFVYFESGQNGIAQTLQNSGTINGLVFLNGGNDVVVNSGTMNSRLLLGDGNDSYNGAAGFHMGSVEGGNGNDTLVGGSGSEALYGDQGDDAISGGGGSDYIEGGAGNDLLDGGLGFDMVSYLASASAVNADLVTGLVTSDVELDFIRGFEEFVGSILADTIAGSNLAETLYGNAGADVINGRGGADIIIGGRGNDMLTGGTGGDIFLFEAGDGNDTITDFDGADDLQIYGYGAYQSITQVGSNVRITLSGTDSIVVQNTTVASFNAGNLFLSAAPAGISIPAVRDEPLFVVGRFSIQQGASVSSTDPETFNGGNNFNPIAVSAAVHVGGSNFNDNFGIWNAGTIQLETTADADWAAASFGGRTFVNLATGVVESAAASANLAIGVARADAVYNAGHITVTNLGGDAAGVRGVSGDGPMVNRGTISVQATGTASGIGESDSSGGTQQIFNLGTITVHGAQASDGIYDYASAHPLAAQPFLVNTGQITVTDDTAIADSAGVRVFVQAQLSIWNSGTINADYAIYAEPISHSASSDYSLTIYNSGTLNGRVQGTSYGDRLINTGGITGTVNMGSGNDLFDGRNGQLTGSVDGYDGNDTILTGAGTQRLFGGFGNDILSGGAGADFLSGGAGADSFRFGTGFGADEILDFGLLGTADFIDVSGHASYQSITQQGSDVLITFSATDTLLVHGVQVANLTGGAIRFGTAAIAANTIPAAPSAPATPAFSPTVGLNPEITFPAIIGTDKANTLIGDIGPDTLIGLEENDILDGRSGNDRMFGGTGNDTYYVDSTGDLIFENLNEGTDTVRSTASFYLFANIESIQIETGAGDLFAVGNDLANTITGNDGSNLLIGGDGNDIINGGDGVDALFGEAGADTLNGGAGIDYLVGGIGNDTLDGGANPDSIYGQDGDDTLIGGASFDTDIMVGGAGNDTLRGDSGLGDYDLMDGGAGNDSYYVDTGDDLTFEAVNGGTDTVYANVAGANNGVYLYANVENLVLLNTTAFGVGNELANTLTGSASSNTLLGGAGNDTINGGAGNDVLFGEAGADTFVFQRGTGGDVIGDFAHGVDHIDIQAFDVSNFAQLQTAFIQNGDVGAINLGGGDFIVLHNVQMSQLTAADFVL